MKRLQYEALLPSEPGAVLGSLAIGASTQGNTAGATGLRDGAVVLAGLGPVSLSQATGPDGNATISISKAKVLPGYFDNTPVNASSTVSIGLTFTSFNKMVVSFTPVVAEYGFPFDMAPQMMVLDFNHSMVQDMGDAVRRTSTYSIVPASVGVSWTYGNTVAVGLYSISGSSILQMVNSGSVSASDSSSQSTVIPTSVSTQFRFLPGATVTVSTGAMGGGSRWIVLDSNCWSSTLSFQQGVEYMMAVLIRVSSTSTATWNSDLSTVTVDAPVAPNGQSFSIRGQLLGVSQSSSRRGILGSASVSAATLGGMQFAGLFLSTTALPAQVNISSITKTGSTTTGGAASTLVMPRVILNNYGAGVL